MQYPMGITHTFTYLVFAHLCLLQTRIGSVCLKDNGDKIVVVQHVLDLVLGVQDGTTQGLPDVVDHLGNYKM